jgi:hypothetical protein
MHKRWKNKKEQAQKIEGKEINQRKAKGESKKEVK